MAPTCRGAIQRCRRLWFGFGFFVWVSGFLWFVGVMGYFVSRAFAGEPRYRVAPEVVMAPRRLPAVEPFIDVCVVVGV